MITLIQEDNPTIFSVWSHSQFMPYHGGTCIGTSTIKLWALETAKEWIELEAKEIDRQIQQIHERTSAVKGKDRANI